MVRGDEAKTAANEILAAALLGRSAEAGLQQLAEATGARGVSLTRLRNGRPLATIASTEWKEAATAFVAGLAPPSPRRFYPDMVYGKGFIGDTDVWPEEVLRHDAYFQEFLRPRGAFFHAKLRLHADPGERLTFSLKRSIKYGPYEPADLAILNSIAPDLRMAVRVMQSLLDAEASGVARALHECGDPVFELDCMGCVRHAHCESNRNFGVIVRGRRLVLSERRAQGALDEAIAAAADARQRPSVVPFSDTTDDRRFLYIIPVTGHARDVFLATAVMVVVVEPKRSRTGKLPKLLGQAFGLTEREQQVANLLAEGLAVPEIAAHLHLGIGTARNHLKGIFAKTETRRQGELVAMLLRLQR